MANIGVAIGAVVLSGLFRRVAGLVSLADFRAAAYAHFLGFEKQNPRLSTGDF